MNEGQKYKVMTAIDYLLVAVEGGLINIYCSAKVVKKLQTATIGIDNKVEGARN